MKLRLLLGVVALAACPASNPPPQYPPPSPPPEQQQSMQQPPPATEQQPAPPPATSEELPVDPTAEMPDQTLGTDATLTLGGEAKATIDARADIFSAGLAKADEGRGGKLPSKITLAAGGTTVTFSKVVGKVGCSGDAAFIADGGDCAGGNTDIQSTKNIGGIVAHDRTLFLVGVFVGAKLPAKAPERLDFSPDKQGAAFASLSPKLGQVFFIGDGKTGTGSGVIQKFVIPSGATSLYLGYADAYSFQGPPGAYGDNKGGLGVTMTEQKE
jgi:hypothetical protein